MANYVKDRADAAKSIKAEGYAFSVVSKSEPTTDLQTLKVSSTPVVVNTFGIETQYELKDIDGTNVRRGDIRVMASALSDEQEPILSIAGNSTFRVAGQKDRLIVAVEPIKVGSVFPLFYWLQVRG